MGGYTNKPVDNVVITFEASLTLLLLCLLIWQVRNSWMRCRCAESFAIFSMTANAVLLFASMLATAEDILQAVDLFSQNWCFLDDTCFLFMVLARSLLYCYWLSRAYYIFECSVFALPKKRLIAIALLITLPNVLIVSALFLERVLDCYEIRHTIKNWDAYTRWALMIFHVISDLIFALALMRLFVRNFHILHLSSNQFELQLQSTFDTLSTKKKRKYTKNRTANCLFIAIGKRTIMCLIGIILAAMLSFFSFTFAPPQWNQSLQVLSGVIYLISSIISYSFAYKLYNLLCCGDALCHEICTNLWFLGFVPDTVPNQTPLHSKSTTTYTSRKRKRKRKRKREHRPQKRTSSVADIDTAALATLTFALKNKATATMHTTETQLKTQTQTQTHTHTESEIKSNAGESDPDPDPDPDPELEFEIEFENNAVHADHNHNTAITIDAKDSNSSRPRAMSSPITITRFYGASENSEHSRREVEDGTEDGTEDEDEDEEESMDLMPRLKLSKMHSIDIDLDSDTDDERNDTPRQRQPRQLPRQRVVQPEPPPSIQQSIHAARMVLPMMRLNSDSVYKETNHRLDVPSNMPANMPTTVRNSNGSGNRNVAVQQNAVLARTQITEIIEHVHSHNIDVDIGINIGMNAQKNENAMAIAIGIAFDDTASVANTPSASRSPISEEYEDNHIVILEQYVQYDIDIEHDIDNQSRDANIDDNDVGDGLVFV